MYILPLHFKKFKRHPNGKGKVAIAYLTLLNRANESTKTKPEVVMTSARLWYKVSV